MVHTLWKKAKFDHAVDKSPNPSHISFDEKHSEAEI